MKIKILENENGGYFVVSEDGRKWEKVDDNYVLKLLNRYYKDPQKVYDLLVSGDLEEVRTAFLTIKYVKYKE